MDSLEYQEIYSKEQLLLIESEFTRLADTCYLDHAGATLYSERQIADVYSDLSENLYSNPHSSKSTQDIIDQIRFKILVHFSTTSEEYSIIFTSGATAALKIVAECFDYASENGQLIYLVDNHTSVLGMREYAPKSEAIHPNKLATIIANKLTTDYKPTKKSRNCLFVYPAQSNFSGTKYPLTWIDEIKSGKLSEFCESNWYVLLDAASFVSSDDLDLSKHKADFIAISFYKIFGYPSALGALLVHNKSGCLLKKKYYGGGTVLMALSQENLVHRRTVLHENFEDGTLPFLSIISLQSGFNTLNRLNLTMKAISQHTFALAKYVFNRLNEFRHCNGFPVTKIYHSTNFACADVQGGIIAFNLLRDDGHYIGYSEVLHAANLFGVHLRTGCFCNPGACQMHLELSSETVKNHFKQGHVCGDQIDVINGQPTGAVRVSFGYMSTKNNADKFLEMVYTYFVSTTVTKKSISLIKPSIANELKGNIKRIFLYPIKSCAAFEVKGSWNLTPSGLEFDRQWMIVNSNGVCVTQKQNSKLCLIKPFIDKQKANLNLMCEDHRTVSVSLLPENTRSSAYFCNSKVCGDRIQGIDCGNEVACWLSEVLNIPGLRLLKQSGISRRSNIGVEKKLSLANECQYLLINETSVEWLFQRIPKHEFDDDFNGLLMRFRPNFIVQFDNPLIENCLKSFVVNNLQFEVEKLCTRCHMICINQLTAQKSTEPLKTLSSEQNGKIRFGVYLSLTINQNRSIFVPDSIIGKQ